MSVTLVMWAHTDLFHYDLEIGTWPRYVRADSSEELNEAAIRNYGDHEGRGQIDQK